MPNQAQYNVIGALPELQWRGLDPVPVEEASYDFSHDQAERKYPYIDGAGHDWTGRGPIKFTAKLCFSNTLQPDLYPHTWEDWRAALFDGSAGELVHPELGTINARVLSGSVKITAHNRAGIWVDVTWVESIKDPTKPPGDFSVLPISLQQAAAAVDVGCELLGIDYPRVEDPPTTNLLGAILAIEGSLFSAGLVVRGMINQVLGAIKQIMFGIELLEPGTNNLASPFNVWALRNNLEVVADGLLGMQQNPGADARPTGSITLATSTTLDDFANRVNNTVAEVIELNPGALGKPSVPAGTVLLFYKAT